MPVNYNITERWEKGTKHHPKSKELLRRLQEIDAKYCNNFFDWEIGGDGDNGETLMYELDILFEEDDVRQSVGENK